MTVAVWEYSGTGCGQPHLVDVVQYIMTFTIGFINGISGTIGITGVSALMYCSKYLYEATGVAQYLPFTSSSYGERLFGLVEMALRF